MSAVLSAAAVFAAALVCIKSFSLFRVCGRSMLPFYRGGDILVCDRFFFRFTGIGAGCVAAAVTAGGRYVLKRITAVSYSGGKRFFFLRGDNHAESADSRHFGWIEEQDIAGHVLFAIPLGRLRGSIRLFSRMTLCHAWGGAAHILVANILLDEIRRCPRNAAGEYEVRFRNLLDRRALTGRMRRNIFRAVTGNPEYFRAGAVGPDFAPDFPSCMTPTHEFRNFDPELEDDYRSHYACLHQMLEDMCRAEWRNYSGNDNHCDEMKQLAYWAGWLTHCASDVYGHHWVGKLAGGDFLTFFPRSVRIAEIIRKHVAVEHYINIYIRNRKFIYGNTDIDEIMDEKDVRLPYPYLRDTFYNNASGPFLHLRGFPIISVLPRLPIDLMSYLYRLADWHETRRAEAAGRYDDAFYLSPARQLWRLVRNWHSSRRDESRRLMDKYLDCGMKAGKIGTEGGFMSMIGALCKYDDFFSALKDYINPLDNLGDAVLGGAFSKLKGLVESIFGSLQDFFSDLVLDGAAEVLRDVSDFLSDAQDNILNNTVGRMLPEDVYRYLKDSPAGLLPDDLSALRDTLPFNGEDIDLFNFPAFYNSCVLAKRLLCFSDNEICDYRMLKDVNNIDCRDQYLDTDYAARDIRNGAIPPGSDYYRYFRQMENIFIAPKTYVGNRRTLELHLDNCVFARAMLSSNRVLFNDVRTALNAGYNGCAHCLLEYDTDLAQSGA